MSAGAFFAGLGLFALVLVPPFAGARFLLRRIWPSATGSLGFLAAWVFTIALISVVSEILGTFGALRRWPLVGCCVAVGAVLSALGLRGLEHERGDRRRFATRNVVAVLALLAAAAVAAAWTTRAVGAWNGGIVDIDSLQYHLPFAATFAQTGTLLQLHYAWLDPTWSFYPFETELFHAIGILTFGRDVLSPALNVGWFGLALLGAWCFGRERGASAPCMLLALGVVGSPLFLITQAGTANSDIGGLALIVCAAALLVATANSTSYALAGTAAGLAASSSLEFLPVVGGLTMGVLLADRRPIALRRCIFVAGLLFTGSFWYLRNLSQIGNPFPSIRSIGSLRLPSPPFPAVARYGFAVIHYASSGRFWDHTVLAGLHTAFGATWPLVLLLSLGGVCASFFPTVTGDLRPVGVAAAVALIVYPITPTTAYGPPGNPFLFEPNLRFLTPGLILGLMALPLSAASLEGTASRLNKLVAGRHPLWLWAVVAAGLLVVVVNLFTGSGFTTTWAHFESKKVLGIGFLVLISAVTLTIRRRALRTAAVIAIAAVTVAVGFSAQRGYISSRYASSRVSVDAWARSVSHNTIGVVAYAEQYPLFGLDLTNQVRYVGIRGPHGSLVSASSCRQWRRELATGGYSYVVIGKNDWGLAPIPNLRWTVDDPAAREILHTSVGAVFSIDSGERAITRC